MLFDSGAWELRGLGYIRQVIWSLILSPALTLRELYSPESPRHHEGGYGCSAETASSLRLVLFVPLAGVVGVRVRDHLGACCHRRQPPRVRARRLCAWRSPSFDVTCGPCLEGGPPRIGEGREVPQHHPAHHPGVRPEQRGGIRAHEPDVSLALRASFQHRVYFLTALYALRSEQEALTRKCDAVLVSVGVPPGSMGNDSRKCLACPWDGRGPLGAGCLGKGCGSSAVPCC